MTGAREAVLGRVRERLARSPDDETRARRDIAERLAGQRRGTQPARIDRDRAGLETLFVEKAEAVDATVAVVKKAQDVPEAVAGYLRERNLPAEAAIAPHAALDTMPWQGSALSLSRRAARGEDAVGIAYAFAGIAETGTLMLASGPDSPATLNFLPPTHIVVLHETDLVGGYEDAWQLLRDAGRGRGLDLPRTVNLITGTSRTGDIEQTLQKGVHGPKRLHIVMVRDGS
ncbi:MAG: lactate utilization protein [Pseudomonadota bacterium]